MQRMARDPTVLPPRRRRRRRRTGLTRAAFERDGLLPPWAFARLPADQAVAVERVESLRVDAGGGGTADEGGHVVGHRRGQARRGSVVLQHRIVRAAAWRRPAPRRAAARLNSTTKTIKRGLTSEGTRGSAPAPEAAAAGSGRRLGSGRVCARQPQSPKDAKTTVSAGLLCACVAGRDAAAAASASAAIAVRAIVMTLPVD